MKKSLAYFIGFSVALICALSLCACALGGNTDKGSDGETYTVTFDAGNGTIFGQRYLYASVGKNSTVSEPNQKPERDGYIFIGWNITGSENAETWNFDTDLVERDTTLYAVWAQACEITLEARGGKFDDSAEKRTIKAARNSVLTIPAVTPPDANHVLKGWRDAYGTLHKTEYPVTRDMTLTAQWELSDEILTALAPFTYRERDGRITITGVNDKDAVTSLTVPAAVSFIDDNAFEGCISLETVVVDDNVSYIGKNAFSGCAKLKSVTLPTELQEIQEYTFRDCASLVEIDIPDTLTRLWTGAFMGCASLTEIVLPAGITEIPGNAFRDCTSLSEVKFGANVTELGSYAFRDCASLEEFEIPSGVETLSGGVFYGCLSLKRITVPATCTEISPSAFSGSGLVTAVIHAKKINSNAFRECRSLASLTIGDEVEELGWEAFRDCTSLTEVVIPDSVTEVAQTFNGCTSLKTVSIGTGLTEIPGGIFSGCYALREVRFGDNITSIGVSAFKDCISLLSFTVPATVTSVDRKAFDGCARLVEIYNLSAVSINKPLSDTVIHTSADVESIIHSVGDFSFCTFKDSIYPYAEKLWLLDYDGDAENLVLPADCEGNGYSIFSYALSCKPKLRSVTLSAGVAAIRNEILFCSDNVTTLAVASGNTDLAAKDNCIIVTADKKFVLGCKTSSIPSDGSVTAIGSNVFCHNKTMENAAFTIPASVTAVGSDAFAGMDGMTRVAENGVRYVDKWAVGFTYSSSVYLDLETDAGTVGISDRAFAANIDSAGKRIKSVKTNSGLKYIGEYAFTFCGFITEVTLNDGLEYIGHGAFSSCEKLEEIVIPDSVTYMGSAVFNYCSALRYAKLSGNLSVIGYQTFSSCGALKSVVIPASVTEIAQSQFWSQSSSITVNPTVYYEGDEAQWKAIKKPIIPDDKIHTVTVVYYSETAPSSGVAWHYGADGKPTTQY